MHTSRYLQNAFTAGRRRSVRLAAVGKIPPPPLRQSPPSSARASASPKTTSEPSAAPSSSLSSRPSSVTAASVSPEKAYERALAADHALAAQQSTLAAMQRQQLFLERRIAEVEDMAVALQGQVTEARRAAGEVALQQQNVEMLVAQMEQRVLAMTATTTAATAAAAATTSAPSAASGNTSSGRGVEPAQGSAAMKEERREHETRGAEEDEEGEEEEEEVEIAFNDELRAEVLQMIDEALARHTPPVLAATATGKPPTHARDTSQPSSDGAATTTTTTTTAAPLVQRLTELDQRLSTLQAQVAQLTLYRIDLTHAAQLATAQATPTAASPAPSLSQAAARLAETLRLCGAITFTDPAGATRVASQVVALRHVPVNMGAAEVRELCVRAAGAGCVVACVVKRVPVHRASRATVERGQQPPRGKDGGGSAAHEVASREDSERVFHVTFDTAEQAVRAVKALHGLRLKTASNDGVGGNPTRPTGSGGGTAAPALVVEPVVSSDIEAALRAMEAQTSPPTST